MRLFTHNFLQCHVRGCVGSPDNYPLVISDDAEIEVRETDFNPDFVRSLVSKIDWKAMSQTAQSLNICTAVPDVPPTEIDEELLRTVHQILLEHYVKSGSMTCRSCGHIYPIRDGIPNMLLGEDEI